VIESLYEKNMNRQKLATNGVRDIVEVELHTCCIQQNTISSDATVSDPSSVDSSLVLYAKMWLGKMHQHTPNIPLPKLLHAPWFVGSS
jgi:hypothetical protein